jgi:hypothetical protein
MFIPKFAADANAQLTIMYAGSPRATFPLSDTDVVRIKNISNGVEGHFELYKGLTTSPAFGTATADFVRRCKPEPDFDERDSLFPDKTDALIEGALQRGEISAPPGTNDRRTQHVPAAMRMTSGTAQEATKDDTESPTDNSANDSTVASDDDVLRGLSVPHAECSNSNWP